MRVIRTLRQEKCKLASSWRAKHAVIVRIDPILHQLGKDSYQELVIEIENAVIAHVVAVSAVDATVSAAAVVVVAAAAVVVVVVGAVAAVFVVAVAVVAVVVFAVVVVVVVVAAAVAIDAVAVETTHFHFLPKLLRYRACYRWYYDSRYMLAVVLAY